LARQPHQRAAGGAQQSARSLAAYVEHRKALGDPEAKEPHVGRHHRQFPSLLEQVEALAAALEAAEERRDRAEQESAYFATLMNAIARRAHLSDSDLERIRAEVRAGLEAESDEPEA
jgi:hypothetical protein